MHNWIQEAIFYHIYPLGFCGSEKYHQEHTTHSITKLIEWITHLKDMHISAVYLGPVFESFEHGYDTSDYRLIDHRLGTNEDFKQVCDALHEAGIRIVLDGVFNHVGRNFWAFLDVKEHREQSHYCDWFANLRFDGNNDQNDGFYYDTWEGHSNLIKLNLRNPEVIDYLLTSIGMWINEFHIDGLRLDAADVMDRDFFCRLKSFCKEIKPDFWLMGEIIHGNYTVWANEHMLDSVTNYECYKGLYSSHNDHNYFEIAHSLSRQFAKGGIYEHLKLYNFVDNHDVNRLASNVKDKQDLFNIYTLLYTMPGIPSIYYGSEWAVEGTKQYGSDAMLRPCLNLQHDLPLTKHIAKLGKLRLELPVLFYGSYEQVLLRNEQFIFKRQHQDECVWIALNLSDTDYQASIDSPFDAIDVLHSTHHVSKNNQLTITIPAKSSCILNCTNQASNKITKQETRSEAVIEEKIGPFQTEDIPLGRYQHFKGKHYSVLYIATHSETLEKYVVYRALYGEGGVWIRPLSMFLEIVEHEGQKVPRFRYIGK